MVTKATSGRATGDPVQNLTQGVEPKRQGRAEGLLALIQTLERDRKISKKDVFALRGVRSPSSFKRIKHELARAGLPITYDRADGYYHIPPEATSMRFGIDPRTRANLAQVRAAVSGLGGIMREALEDVLDVFEARIALDDPEAIAVVTSRHPQPKGGRAFYDALDRSMTAVRDHRWLTFVYEPTAGGERTARAIAPYALHAHDGRYYVWRPLPYVACRVPTCERARRRLAVDFLSLTRSCRAC